MILRDRQDIIEAGCIEDIRNQDEFVVDPLKAAVITFGDGIVAKTSDDGETTVFTF